jgi:2-oxoglutarate ferredoxin oxidoreductase subunit beta
MFDYLDLMRTERMPHIWCPGCGNGIIVKSMLRAIDKLGWKRDEIVNVSGIGCSSRTPGYLDFNTLHTTHGRSLAFATGVKAYRPELKVIAVSGDGDAVAIGGNHFIHACRRNIDITLIVYNNYIYGMTGGQNSPTTPEGSRSTTMVYGNIEPPFDICQLAIGAGATFVARTTVAHPVQMENLIKQGLVHKGFSVIEVIVNCPTAYGRRNKLRNAAENIKQYKDNAVRVEQAKKMTPDELKGKIITGLLHTDTTRGEYTEQYAALVARLHDPAKP